MRKHRHSLFPNYFCKVQYTEVWCCALHRNAIVCSAVQLSMIHFNILQLSIIQCNVVQLTKGTVQAGAGSTTGFSPKKLDCT